MDSFRARRHLHRHGKGGFWRIGNARDPRDGSRPSAPGVHGGHSSDADPCGYLCRLHIPPARQGEPRPEVLPPALAGIVCGWLLMPHIPAQSFGPLIGWLTIALVVLVLVQKFAPRLMNFAVEHPGIAWPFGWLAGSTTMIANAAGPVMTIYLLACRLPKFEFVGTAAWFFFAINLFKVPFSASSGADQWRQPHVESLARAGRDRRNICRDAGCSARSIRPSSNG